VRYFFDTEFIEDGSTIDLISIGIVRDDGKELYCCNRDAKLHLASDWVRENVLPLLPSYKSWEWRSRSAIANCVRNFVLADQPIEFWAYYADYDWVALCQLFGTMMALPHFFPKFCMDLKQLSVMRGSPQHPPQASGAHNALEDARYNKTLFEFLGGASW